MCIRGYKILSINNSDQIARAKTARVRNQNVQIGTQYDNIYVAIVARMERHMCGPRLSTLAPRRRRA